MRVCVAFYSENNKKIVSFAKSLALGVEEQGVIVDLVDISKDNDKRLTGYKYILFGCGKSSTFSSKANKSFLTYIKNCGNIIGKHTFAFTNKGFLNQKLLLQIMKNLESEGVLLKSSAVISSNEQAKIIGRKLHIK